MISTLDRRYLDQILKSQPISATKPLEEEDIKQYKILLRESLCLQDPAVRQIFIALTGKYIKRIKDSHRVVMRDQKMYSQDQRTLISNRYTGFINWLINFCFESIYCNAYFGSYTLIMSTLKLIINHITFTNPNLSIQHLFTEKRCFDSILSCLNDSFEENKALALELLYMLPHDYDCSSLDLKVFEDIAYQLVASVNPAHSLTCQYVFKLSINLEYKKNASNISRNKILLQKLNHLADMVQRGVKETEDNFVVALKHNAIYPKLTCIRALLTEIDISKIDEDRDEWRALAQRVVNSSIAACRAVSTIVCNLNPETIGHLPMDQEPIELDTLSKSLNLSLNITQSDLNTITSQLLLISGWKTIKECSLSLGTLCTRLWWPKGGFSRKGQEFPGLKESDALLDTEDIVKIIRFFDHYLRNLRHRGAFEQAYNGFIMVTRRIWHEKTGQNMLIQILEEIMKDFTEVVEDDKMAEQLKAFITRRSAGLPFIIQAILISEEEKDTKILDWIMKSLFSVLETDKSQTYQKIHCLNILKAVIKEHYLREKVTCYVGKTFALTLDCFSSGSFPIRNCANMLLKATVDRAFGTNRSKFQIHHKNMMTFGKFFLDFPELHNNMIKHLENGLKPNGSIAAVHGVFIILSRLRSNLVPNEGFQSNDNLIRPFIQPIMELAFKSEDLKIRELSSQLAFRLDFILRESNQSETQSIIWQHIDFGAKTSASSIITSLMLLYNSLHVDYSEQSKIDDKSNLAIEKIKGILESDAWNERFSYYMKCQVFDVILSLLLVNRNDCAILIETLFKENIKNQIFCNNLEDPLAEMFIFKGLVLMLLGSFVTSKSPNGDQIFDVMKHVFNLIMNETEQDFSSPSDSVKGALLRFIRQQISFSRDDYELTLLDKLDIDATPTYRTPIDRMNNPHNSDAERLKWSDLCNCQALARTIRLHLANCSKLLNLKNYHEFQPRLSDDSHCKFTSKISNSPRAIELLTLSSMLDIKTTTIKETNLIESLKFTRDFLDDLPDCDVKCLAMIYCAKIMKHTIRSYLSDDSPYLTDEHILLLDHLGLIFDELADGDHSNTIRETCCYVIRGPLKELTSKRNEKLQLTLARLLSVLIKLNQDEDVYIRNISNQIIHDVVESLDNNEQTFTGNPLQSLIRLVTSRLFNKDSDTEANRCFELLTRIVFNHSKNYSTSAALDKGGLFDKTKLNSFADHVRSTSSVFEELKSFLQARKTPIKLNALNLSSDILLEFQEDSQIKAKDLGDYAWRRNSLVNGVVHNGHGELINLDNNNLVDGFIETIHESLDYFAQGYRSMLTDTGYTYHELSLYKRAAFVIFVTQCTRNELRNIPLMRMIQEKLAYILKYSCSTTLLVKTHNLLSTS